jgi:hypothetical protein
VTGVQTCALPICLTETVHRIAHGCHPYVIGTIELDYTPNAGRQIAASSRRSAVLLFLR